MKKAFTLAEVLITLVVIGIVAAITINIIISNQEEAYRSGLKKSASAIQQAFRNAAIDNGGFIPINYDSDSRDVANMIFKKQMRIAKDCGDVVCNIGKKIEIKNLTGNDTIFSINSYVTYDGFVILQDGTFLRVYSVGKSPENMTLSTVSLVVDVNGIYKGPNRMGKDVFYLQYNARQDRIIPGGALGNPSMDICDKSDKSWNGAGCAAIVLRGEKVPK